MLDTITDRFVDRRAAGRELGERLSSLAVENPVVLGLARGGVPVAYEVAKALEAPLDVLVVRKIGAPGNPEYGIGAIAEGGITVLDHHAIRRLLISGEELESVIALARAQVDARVARYRRDRPPLEVEGHTPSSSMTGWRPAVPLGLRYARSASDSHAGGCSRSRWGRRRRSRHCAKRPTMSSA